MGAPTKEKGLQGTGSPSADLLLKLAQVQTRRTLFSETYNEALSEAARSAHSFLGENGKWQS